jgi:hypothetical protein
MPINTLPTTTDAMTSNDVIPYAPNGGGTSYQATLAKLLTFFQSTFTSPTFTVQAVVPVSGDTRAIGSVSTSVWLIMTPAATLATLTITLPPVASAVDGQTIMVSTSQELTALTVTASGATVATFPTRVSANASFTVRYNAANLTWYQVALSTTTYNSLAISTIIDRLGNEVIELSAVAGAANHISVTQAVTGFSPSITARGDDTNLDIDVKGKGTGVLKTNAFPVVASDPTRTFASVSLTTPVIGAGTLAALEAARITSGFGTGCRGTQTNASVTTFNSNAAAGGSSIVPVFYDAVAVTWKVG